MYLPFQAVSRDRDGRTYLYEDYLCYGSAVAHHPLEWRYDRENQRAVMQLSADRLRRLSPRFWSRWADEPRRRIPVAELIEPLNFVEPHYLRTLPHVPIELRLQPVEVENLGHKLFCFGSGAWQFDLPITLGRDGPIVARETIEEYADWVDGPAWPQRFRDGQRAARSHVAFLRSLPHWHEIKEWRGWD